MPERGSSCLLNCVKNWKNKGVVLENVMTGMPRGTDKRQQRGPRREGMVPYLSVSNILMLPRSPTVAISAWSLSPHLKSPLPLP